MKKKFLVSIKYSVHRKGIKVSEALRDERVSSWEEAGRIIDKMIAKVPNTSDVVKVWSVYLG